MANILEAFLFLRNQNTMTVRGSITNIAILKVIMGTIVIG